MSDDYGDNWRDITPSGGYYWVGISLSGSGAVMTAITDYGSTFYISSNFGASWTAVTVPGINYIVMASCGRYQMGSQARGGAVYLSSDYGASWSAVTTPSALAGGSS